jgi:hypothetical protein
MENIRAYILRVRGEGAKLPLSPFAIDVLNKIVESEDPNLYDALFWFTVYLEPGYFKWLYGTGSPGKKYLHFSVVKRVFFLS